MAREVLYGRQAVRESLRAGRRKPYRLLLAEGVRQTDVIGQIVSLAHDAGIPVVYSERHTLDRLVRPVGGAGRHQGVVLETAPYPYVVLDEVLEKAVVSSALPLVLLLDQLQDPQNVGSLMRTAEAAGVHGVVIQRRRAAAVTPAVVRASAGAVEHVRVAEVTNLVRAMGTLKTYGLWLAGLEGVPEAAWYDQADLTLPLGVVVGSEGLGLRRLVRERCDFLLRLPMAGRVNSLNAAVAGAIVLYEIVRQRRETALGN